MPKPYSKNDPLLKILEALDKGLNNVLIKKKAVDLPKEDYKVED